MKKILLLLLSLFVIFSQADSQNDSVRHRPKIGLVLSGGGALGFAHIGALKVIDSLGIPIDYIAGTSFGALIGGLYSIGYRQDSLQQIAEQTNWTGFFSDNPTRRLLPFMEKKYDGRYQIRLGLNGFTPTVPTGAIAGQKISLLFSRLTQQYAEVENFDSLPIPFRCVAVDLITGRQVVLSRGPLALAMRATMSIPTAFTPVEYGDSLLIDGGILNNYPVDVLKAMGADIIIGVDVSGYNFSREDATDLLKVMDRASMIARYQQLESFRKMTTIYIEPELSDFGIADFNHETIRQIMERGHEAAERQIGKLIRLRTMVDTFPNETLRQSRKTVRADSMTIHGIQIVGNENLDFSFIFGLLNIKVGTVFSTDEMEQQINRLYALGYFETITYTIHAVDAQSVNVIVHVREKPFRELNVGFRYDDFYKLVALIGIRSTNILVSGVRFESELEFSGLTRASMKISYPSRSLDQPIYPFLSLRYLEEPLHVYYPGFISDYSIRSMEMGIGTGFTIDKALNVEIQYGDELRRTISSTVFTLPEVKNRLRYVMFTMGLDYLDDIFVPRTGIVINSTIEYSQRELGSDLNYTRILIKSDYYATISRRHTLRLKSEYMNVLDSPPLSKQFFIGGPEEFAGANYQQIYGTRFIIARGEYRYEFKRDIFFKGIVNTIFDPNSLNVFNPTLRTPQFGFGAAVMFTSILGNFEFTLARGNASYYNPDQKQVLLHFSAGMKF